MHRKRHHGRAALITASLAAACLISAPLQAQVSAGGRSPIYLEDSPDGNDLLAKANELVQASRLAEAAEVYQKLMQDYGRKLVGISAQVGKATSATSEKPFLHSDIRVYVSHELGKNPALLEAYQRLYEGAASAQLATAMQGRPPVDAEAPVDGDAAPPSPAGIRIDIAALERVYRQYGLCASGLEAGLRLAGLSLARGAVADAMAVLDTLESHPLLSTQMARFQQLQAAAGIFGGDPLRLKLAKQAMADRHDEQALTQVTQWESHASPVMLGGQLMMSMVQVVEAGTSTQPADPDAKPVVLHANMPTNLAKPLWSVPLSLADTGPREAQARMMGMPVASVGFPTLPVVDGDRLIINFGDEVQAIERHSGRRLWLARRTNPSIGSDANFRMRSAMVSSAQPRGVAIEGTYRTGAVMTAIVGQPSFIPSGWGGMQTQSSTVVMGIGSADGKVLWEVSPGEVDESLEQGAFVGTPQMFGGRTYVLLRRAQVQGLQHTVAVALDSATGRVLWKRSLASANYLSGPIGSAYLNINGGRLFVGDSLGTTVCLDCYDGTIRWLNTSGSRPMAEYAEGRRWGIGVRNQGEASPVSPSHEPIFLEAGVLIPAGGVDDANSQVAATVLDPETGSPRKGISDAALKDALWGEAEYVTKVGDDVLVVGATIARLDGKTLAIKWSRRLDAVVKNARVMGAPAVTSDMVVIPTSDRILAFQLDGGKIAADAEIDSPGNLLLLNGQLICVNEHEVRGFLDWKVAYDRLKGQIERDGKTASSLTAALTLAQLASAAGIRDAMLEGADIALACAASIGADKSTERAPNKAMRRELFDQLLNLADTDRYVDIATRRALFERVASAAQGPADEVVYRISLGNRLSGAKLYAEAVDQFQSILSDTALASQLYERNGDSRQAGLEARVQMGKLIADAGPGVYAKYDTMAAQRLNDLTAQGTQRDPAALIDIARQMPYAKVVPSALLAAGEAFLSSGNSAEAILQLRRAYAVNRDTEILPRLAGTMVSAYVANKQPRQALVWLMRLKREHADLEPVRGGKPVSLDAWIAELSTQTRGEDSLPSLVLPLGKPTAIAGQLLLPSAQNEDSWPGDRMLVQCGAQVTLYAGDSLEQKWQSDFPAEDAAELVLISHTRQSCVFYLPQSRMLRVLDAGTGKELWITRTAEEVLADAGSPNDRRKDATPEQRKFMEEVNQGNVVFRNGKILTPRDVLANAGPALFAKCNEQVVCIADHLGRVVALERATGRVLWKLLCPFDRLDFLELSAETLALAGQTAFTSDSSTGNILIIDPLTGETRKSVEDKDPPLWVAVNDDGRLLVATATQLLCRSPEDGEIAWRWGLPEGTLTYTIRVQGDLILARAVTGEILVVDASTGNFVNRFANTESPNAQNALVLRPAQDNWHVLTSTTATMIDGQGKVRWRDAIRPEEKHFISQMISDKFVALVAVTKGPREQALLPGSTGPTMGQVGAGNGGVIINNGVIQGNVRFQVRVQGPMAAPVVERGAPQWEFKIFFLDRQTGKITAEQAIAPMPVPLKPTGAMMLNHRIILSTAAAVIVLPDATVKP